METTQVLTPPQKKKKFAPENLPGGKFIWTKCSFFGDYVKLPSCNTLFIGKRASSGRWEISPLLSALQVELPLQFTGRNGSPLIQTPTNSCPGTGMMVAIMRMSPGRKGNIPLTKPGWAGIFFWGGVALLSFWGGWRFHRSLPKEKARFFFHSLRRKIFKQPRGAEVFYCSGPTSPWEWGKVSKSFFGRGGNPRNLQGRWEIWTMVAPPRLGYRIDIIWIKWNCIYDIGCLSSQVL